MNSPNCWEVKNCGREPDGHKEKELGICPATIEPRTNGVNSGKYGGRVCWAIAETFCGNTVQGSFAMKISSCRKCHFYHEVRLDEGMQYVNSVEILKIFK